MSPTETETFEEDDGWRLGATDFAVDSPIQPYLTVDCPHCETPNCFDYGVRKDEMPVNCVECDNQFRLRVSVEPIESENHQSNPQNEQ